MRPIFLGKPSVHLNDWNVIWKSSALANVKTKCVRWFLQSGRLSLNCSDKMGDTPGEQRAHQQCQRGQRARQSFEKFIFLSKIKTLHLKCRTKINGIAETCNSREILELKMPNSLCLCCDLPVQLCTHLFTCVAHTVCAKHYPQNSDLERLPAGSISARLPDDVVRWHQAGSELDQATQSLRQGSDKIAIHIL